MSCGSFQGYPLPCRDSIGGINSVRILQWDYIDTSASGVVTSSSGVITTLTPTSSKKFAKYVLMAQNKDTFSLGDPKPGAPENGTLYFEQMVKFKIAKLQASLRDEITLLGQNRLAIIVEDQNGNFWLLGEKKGLEMIDSTANSGADRGDFNGYELSFSGKEPAMAQQVSSSIIAGLTQ